MYTFFLPPPVYFYWLLNATGMSHLEIINTCSKPELLILRHLMTSRPHGPHLTSQLRTYPFSFQYRLFTFFPYELRRITANMYKTVTFVMVKLHVLNFWAMTPCCSLRRVHALKKGAVCSSETCHLLSRQPFTVSLVVIIRIFALMIYSGTRFPSEMSPLCWIYKLKYNVKYV